MDLCISCAFMYNKSNIIRTAYVFPPPNLRVSTKSDFGGTSGIRLLGPCLKPRNCSSSKQLGKVSGWSSQPWYPTEGWPKRGQIGKLLQTPIFVQV